MRLEHDPERFGQVTSAGSIERERWLHGWLARFAPLLEGTDRLNAAECRRALEQVKRLREDAATLAGTVAIHPDEELESTFREAMGQLDGIESDLRRRMALLAPGDPSGTVDLDSLRARMAEAAARREVEQLAPTPVSERRLALDIPEANRAQGVFMGVFSFGWLSFTTMHCILMIGGMARSGLGWGALFLLGFYAIFFMVGFGMAWGAANAFARESVELLGDRLVVRRTLGPWKREQEVLLGPESQAYVTQAQFSNSNQRQAMSTEIAVTAADGKEVRFGSGRPGGVQRNLVNRINEYLAALRS